MSQETFQPYVDWLAQNPLSLLLTIFLISLIESLAIAGILVPGVVMLFVVAIAAGNIGIDPSLALLAGVLGAISGDAISFYLGRRFKHSLRQLWPFSRYPEAIQMGEQFFTRHGGKSIFLGRFVGPLRAIIPLVAGMMNMNPWHFLAFNLASALAWAPFYILPGYLSGAALNATLPEHFELILGVTATLVGLLALLFQQLSHRLQVGSHLYDAIEVKKEDSALFRWLWHFLISPQTPGKEFPLASLTLFVLALVGFIVWTGLTLFSANISVLNQTLLNFAAALRNAVFDPFLVSLTLLGDEAFLYLSFSLLVAVMLLLKRPMAALHLVAAGLATAAITHGLKASFAIPRPDLVLVAPNSFAYPSGHSSGIVVFYGLVASFIAQTMVPKTRWQIYLAFGVPMLLVAFSRVLLGVHWLTDIVGGILLGLVLCGLMRISYSRWIETPAPSGPSQKGIIAGGLLIWLIAAVSYQVYCFDTEQQRYQLKPSAVSTGLKSSAADTPDRSSPTGSASAQFPTAATRSVASQPDGSRQNQSPDSTLPPSDAPPTP